VSDLVTLLAAAVVFVALAATTFPIGLRRYTSNALWSRA